MVVQVKESSASEDVEIKDNNDKSECVSLNFKNE
jgi:hypothetical protein